MPTRSAAGPPLDELEEGYWHATRRPLMILAFLAPFVLAYELGLALALRTETGLVTIKAHHALLRFFDVFGVPTEGLYLGGVVIVVVILVWHLLARDPWHVDPGRLGLMAVESAALAAPLLLLSRAIAEAGWLPAFAPGAAGDPGAGALAGMTLWEKLSICVGAGLYEELLFRMLCIALLHTLLVDLARLPQIWGVSIAVVVSAVLFAHYHPIRLPGGGLDVRLAVFYLLAGLYFGLVYVVRGYGIVVAVHALYDMTVALLAESG